MTNFHHIFFHSGELYWVHEMPLEFNAPPSIRYLHGHSLQPSEIDAEGEFLDVTFDTGFHRERLLSLLSEMVCCVGKLYAQQTLRFAICFFLFSV